MYFEIIIVAIIVIFVLIYRKNTGDNSYKFITKTVANTYEKYAPYSFKVVREKAKELGQEYTTRQYVIQIVIFGVGAAFVSFLYFYSIIWSIVYATAAIMIIPYLTYMRCKKAYSEYIFEQVQVYCTNTIMEFSTTQAFVKSLEGVVASGVLEEPLLSDVKTMIALSYEKGWVKDIGKYCGLNDGSSALQICAGGDWTFHAAVWLSSAKELSGKLYVAFLSGTTVKYSAGDFSFNRDVRAKAVSQYCDRSRAVLRTVSPAETLGGTN